MSPAGRSDAPPPSAPPPADRLAFREKALVGAGGIAVQFGNYAVKAMAMPVYNMLLGVDPAGLGVVLALPRLWDAFVDPWVGHVSDNWKSRFGRRRPFILFGAVIGTLSYGVIWAVSPAWSERAKLAWLLATSLVFYTCYAFFAVPYQSLTFELTPDYDERTSVMAHYSCWYKLGGLAIDWLFPLSTLGFFASRLAGVRAMNWAGAVVMMGALGSLPAFFGRERYFKRAAAQPREPFWPAWRAAVTNRALLILIALTVFQLCSSMIASGMDYYLLVYYVHHGRLAAGAYWKGMLTTGYAVVGFASIPVLGALSRRLGKRPTVVWVYVLALFGGLGKWLVFRPGAGWWVLADPLLSGPILVALNMVIPSMVADVCDEDELRCGRRREGMFGAVFLWIQKAGTALAFLCVGLVLDLSGFSAKLGGAQAPHTFLWMRLSLAGSTSLTAAAAIIVALFYPITREGAARTRRQLEARRGAV